MGLFFQIVAALLWNVKGKKTQEGKGTFFFKASFKVIMVKMIITVIIFSLSNQMIYLQTFMPVNHFFQGQLGDQCVYPAMCNSGGHWGLTFIRTLWVMDFFTLKRQLYYPSQNPVNWNNFWKWSLISGPHVEIKKINQKVTIIRLYNWFVCPW